MLMIIEYNFIITNTIEILVIMRKIFKKYILALTSLFVIFSSVLFCCTGWGMGAEFELMVKKDCNVAASSKKMSCHAAMDKEQSSSKQSDQKCNANNLISDIAENIDEFKLDTQSITDSSPMLLEVKTYNFQISRERIQSILAFDTVPIPLSIPLYLVKSSFLF